MGRLEGSLRTRIFWRAFGLAVLTTLLPLPVPGSAATPEPSFPLGAAGVQDTAQGSSQPGASLTVYLMTIGQGDAIWERFGHNAIWIRDGDTGWEAAYNWGMFSFGEVDFIPRLFKGTMLYWMAPRDPAASLEESRWADRSVRVQQLALTPRQKWDLLNFVEWNARPENMYYRYDYYRDNCSTRVRDALDRVLEGRIRTSAEGTMTDHTYRWHTRRLLRDAPAAYLGIQTVLGPSADEPLTAWEEAFLPIRLMEEIRKVRVPDGQGGTRPLVVEERQLLESTRAPEPEGPPFAFPWFLLVGLIWGGGILVLSRKGRRLGMVGRLSLLGLAGGWTLLAGVSGSLLLAAWLFTDHSFWYRNLNLLQLNPLFLPLPIAFLLFSFRASFPRWARDLATFLGVLAGVGVVVSVLPGIRQANAEILALTAPLNAALVLSGFQLFDVKEDTETAPRDTTNERGRV
ncbi:MAG: lipoprotein N-acyltransferase Lnb domain-containing protein [Longimicrobiales bacterium]